MAAAAFIAAAMALGCAVAGGSHWEYPHASTREVTVPCEPAQRSIQPGDASKLVSPPHSHPPAVTLRLYPGDFRRFHPESHASDAPREIPRTFSPLYRRPPPGIL